MPTQNESSNLRARQDRGAASRILCTAPLVGHRDPISAEEVRQLAHAASGAGFDGIVLWSRHADWAAADGFSFADLAAFHEHLGLSVPAVEVVLDWAAVESDRRDEVAVFDVAVAVGATDVIAATLDPPGITTDLARSLTLLCDRAADRGLAICLEFLPWSAVNGLSAATRLIDAVDRDNLGLVLDSWHWCHQPGGPDLHEVGKLPPDRVRMLQLNDVPRHRVDVRTAAVSGRLLPGEGRAPLDALIEAIELSGAQPLVAPEVFSNSLAARGPAEMARRVFDATGHVMRGRLGWGTR